MPWRIAIKIKYKFDRPIKGREGGDNISYLGGKTLQLAI